MSLQYAVFGHPIGHSLSPRIHAAFALACGIALDYRTIDAPAEQFPQLLAQFHAAGGNGANVTLPLKALVFGYCEEVSAAAQRAGTVNTLARTASGWNGHNTDGAGLIHDLTQRLGFGLSGKRVLLLGAGGAARGVLWPLLDAGIGDLLICNRTVAAAEQLAASAGDPARVRACSWGDLDKYGGFDLIVNATSAGHGGTAFDAPLALAAPGALCYDLSYGAAAQGFLAWSETTGAARAQDGLGMLVEQAAAAFLIWHGIRPATDAIYAELRQRLAGAAVPG